MNRVLVVFSDGLLSELDSARGLVSRSAWIRQAVEDKLMKEAAAPLVPEAPKRVWKGTAAEWAAFEEGAGFETPQDEFVKNFPANSDADAQRIRCLQGETKDAPKRCEEGS